ncbi:MAG: hypothetical protein J6A17_04300 [Bacilli bacterium]|nr:hypothetical protein [Bacilli bacterium]
MKKNNQSRRNSNSMNKNIKNSNKKNSNNKNVGFVKNNSRSFEYDPDSEHSFDLRDCK